MEKRANTINFYAWLCWFVTSLLFMIQYGLQIFPEVNINELQHHFNVGDTEIGIFSSVFIVLYVLMQIPVGLLLDRFKVQYLLSLAAFLLCLGCVVLIATDKFIIAILSRIIMGLGAGFTFLGAIYMAKRYLFGNSFSLAMSLTQAMPAAASLIFTFFLNYLKQLYSWQYVLLGIATFLFIWSIILILLRDRGIKKSISKHAFDNFKWLLKNKYIWLLGLFLGFSMVHIYVVANLWGVKILEIRYQLTPLQAEVENSLLIVGFMLGTLCGYLFIQFFRRQVVLLGYAVIQSLAVILVHYASLPNYLQIFMLFVSGLSSGSTFLCFDLARLYVAEEMFGATAGFINTFFGIFAALNIVVVSFLLQATNHNFYIAIIPVLLSSILAVLCGIGIYRYRMP